MSKEKKKRGTGQRSGKKLVPRITIPLDEYEFLRDVVDAARSVSDAYGLSNLRALHCAVARLETLLEKSSVLTERGAEEHTYNPAEIEIMKAMLQRLAKHPR